MRPPHIDKVLTRILDAGTPNFGRQNELAARPLLALCMRKMELLSARWTEFDLERGVWSLHPSRTKMSSA